MDILFGAEFQESLKCSLQNAQESVVILSAFVKEKALLWLNENLSDSCPEVAIVARWDCQDLISGVSDLSCFEFCQQKDWNFAIDNNLHCKIYLIDSSEIFLGSANLTQKGLHLTTNCNFEAGTKFNISKTDSSRLKRYIQSCVSIDWDQYEKIKQFVERNVTQAKSIMKWPQEIMSLMNSKIEFLWVNDMILNPPQYYIENSLIGQLQNTRENFTTSKSYKWLLNQFNIWPNEYLNFGQITSSLHNSLLDDPKPYRTTVKKLVANLFEWVRYLNIDDIGIKKFNHTEALFLTKEQE